MCFTNVFRNVLFSVTLGAVALAEVIADNTRLVRLDLQENDIKTAGLMALSLALKVNENITRLDVDRDTKKETVCIGSTVIYLGLLRFLSSIGQVVCPLQGDQQL